MDNNGTPYVDGSGYCHCHKSYHCDCEREKSKVEISPMRVPLCPDCHEDECICEKIKVREFTSIPPWDTSIFDSEYTVKVYVDHGYFQYRVKTKEQAMEHGHVIMASGVYRRVNSDKSVEFYKVSKVKISGEGLGETAYPDTFMRT